jgi:hypothetical protein
MTTTWWTHDQAKAWVVWQDDKSVERVGPSGDISFERLYAEYRTHPRTSEIQRSSSA